jgi:hypothetical protein
MPATSTDRIDGLTTSVAIKAACRVTTSTAVVLYGIQTIGGVTLESGDRILVKDQTDTTTNGIYVVGTTAWTRARDFDGTRDCVQGTLVPVYSDGVSETLYKLTTDNPVVIGSSAIVFTQSIFLSADAAGISFLQSGTGAVTRTLQDKMRDVISVKDFGAVCDDTTDDTAAIQRAIDALGGITISSRAGPDILIPGPCRITSTLTIQRKGIRLVGNGWGNRDDTGTRRSYLRWDGAAASPMVKFIDCWAGAGISRLKLMGKTSAKPSAAIQLHNTNTGVVNGPIFLNEVYVGGFSGETGAGTQFTDGILWTGTNNNSEHRFDKIVVTGCSGIGVRQASIQNLNVNIDKLEVSACGTGVKVTGTIYGTSWVFANNAIDISSPVVDDDGLSVNSHLAVTGYYSELGGRMLDVLTGRFIFRGGQFQITASLNADGKVILNDGNVSTAVELTNFRFTQATAPPASPNLSFRSSNAGAGDRSLVFDAIVGWDLLTGGVNGLNITTRGQTDRFYIYLRCFDQLSSSAVPRVAQNLLAGGFAQDFDITRFDEPFTIGTGQIKLHDDFLGDVLADQWNGVVGSDAQCVAPAITSIVGGAVRMTTGDDAAASMAVNGVQLDSYLNWRGTTGAALIFEARVRMNAITNVVVFVGLTDQVGTLEMPFTLAAGNVLTSNASDAVGWLFDTGADNDNWWLVGVAADVDATKQNTALAPVANTFEILRVEVLYDGSAVFYRNGVKVGTTMSSALRSYPTAPAMTPVIAAFSRAAASRSIDADYIHVQQNRAT